MSSGICVNFRLDPFYQQFLRTYFACNDIVFRFPNRSRYKFNELIHYLLDYPPENFKLHDFNELSFRVEIPYAEYFDIVQRNYVSEKGLNIFSQKVREFYLFVFHEHMKESVVKLKLPVTDSIDRFVEKYIGNHAVYDERLKKDFTRTKQRIRMDYYNQNRKKNTKKIFS